MHGVNKEFLHIGRIGVEGDSTAQGQANDREDLPWIFHQFAQWIGPHLSDARWNCSVSAMLRRKKRAIIASAPPMTKGMRQPQASSSSPVSSSFAAATGPEWRKAAR